MSAAPHRTPLRRVSRGSLSALSRSHNDNSAPAGLQFLGPTLEILSDEVDALSQNVDGLNKLSSTLERFNESFASYLFIQKINAFSVEWFEAPTEESHELAAQRQEAQRSAAAALEVTRRNQQQPQAAPVTTKSDSINVMDHTLPGDTTFGLSEIHEAPGPNDAKSKKKVKPKLTAKEKKERTVIFEKVCAILPLEFRGGDPTLRRQIEHVLDCLFDAKRNGLKITDMVRADINQARVNKCLIALTSRKVVRKEVNMAWEAYGYVTLRVNYRYPPCQANHYPMLTPLLTFFGKQPNNNSLKRSPPHLIFNRYLDKQDSGLKGLNGAETIIHQLRLQRPVRLVLSHNELGNEGCVALFDYLCSNEGRCRHYIEEIGLNANGIGDKGLLAIAKYLDGNTYLGSLYLQDNEFKGDRFVMFRFTVALNRSNLHTLSLTSNADLGEALTDTFLPNLSAPNLIALHLSVCSLGPEAVSPLLSYLTSPRAVRLFTLKLNGNNFGLEGVQTILNSIERHNWSLSWLEMHACGVNYDLLWRDFEKQLRVRILDRNKYLANETAREALYLLPHARPALLPPRGENKNDDFATGKWTNSVFVDADIPAGAETGEEGIEAGNSGKGKEALFSRSRVSPALVSARPRLPLELTLHILSYLAPTLSPAQLARVCAYAEDRSTLPSLSVRLSLPISPSLLTAGNTSYSHGRLNPYLNFNLSTPAVVVGDINSRGISQPSIENVNQRKAWLQRVGCDRYDPGVTAPTYLPPNGT